MTDLQFDFGYAEFWTHRRSFLGLRDAAPVVYAGETANGYRMYMQDGLFVVSAVAEGDDLADFLANKLPFCNQYDIPGSLSIQSHNFADNSSWVGGTSKSRYVYAPMAGKCMMLRRVLGLVDNGTSMGANQHFNFVLWESLAAPCPVLSGSDPTPFGTPAFDGTNGWLQVYPAANDPQEVKVYLCFSGGVPQYKVSHFRYTNLNDLKAKSNYRIEGSALTLEFNYKQDLAFLLLRSSVNERIEAYIGNNTEYLSLAGIPARITIVAASYNEF